MIPKLSLETKYLPLYGQLLCGYNNGDINRAIKLRWSKPIAKKKCF